MSETHGAAIDYAAAGWPVLPLHTAKDGRCSCGKADCPSPAKHPRLAHGLKEASTDLELVNEWWGRWPNANVGLRTGVAFDVLDLDGDEGRASIKAALEEQSIELPTGPSTKTGGGGSHLLFLPTGAGNRAGILPKVDWRGRNGYIVAPPSVHASGQAYLWRTSMELELPPAPEWLSRIVAPPRDEQRPRGEVKFLPGSAGDGTPYGLQALDAELAELARAQQGERNASLNECAFALYQLVAGGELRENVVEERLRTVGISIGLGEGEVMQTIGSARQGGMQQPRSAPELKMVMGGRPEVAAPPQRDEEPKERLLRVRWVTDAQADPPEERPELVEGLLRVGETMVIGAARGIGKSWMAYGLAAQIARGEGNFLGALPVRRSAKVLIAQGELDEWGAYTRWRKLTGDSPPEGVAESFDQWRLRVTSRRVSSGGRDASMNWSESDEYIEAVLDARVEATITEVGFGVLIVDPWRTFFGGKENNNDEAEAGLAKLSELAAKHGTTVVIFAHLGKSTEGRDPEDLWRGASRLADWAASRVTLLPHFSPAQAEKQGMTRQQARRYVDVKLLRRNGEPTEDFSIAWDPQTGWWDRWGNPTVMGGRRKDLLPVEVAKVLEECGGEWPSLRKAAEALEMGHQAAQRVLDQAVREDWIQPFEGPNRSTGYRLNPAEEEF